MAPLRIARPRAVTVAAIAASLLVSACSSDDSTDDLPTIERPVAADSPATATAPAGTTIPLSGGVSSLAFEPASGRLAALVGGTTVTIVDPADPGAAATTVTLAKPARQLATAGANTVVAVGDHFATKVDLVSATSTDIPLDADGLSVTGLPDGRVVVGTDDGRTLVLDQSGAVVDDISGLTSVDALATLGDSAVALDRRQTSVTLVDPGSADLDLSLRAGEGATNLVTDEFQRVLVTDTTGDELLVFSSDPFLLRQRFPVGSAPYAIAYDDRTDLVWVTLPKINEAVGFELSSGIPVEVARFPTVRQPNAIAVNAAAGQIYVASATGEGIQRVDVATLDVRKAGGR